MEEQQFQYRRKQEFIEEMYKHYDRQKELCELKWKSALEIEKYGKAEANTNRKTKKENTDLKEYNNQVAALGKTITIIMNITKSDLPVDEEKDFDDDIL